MSSSSSSAPAAVLPSPQPAAGEPVRVVLSAAAVGDLMEWGSALGRRSGSLFGAFDADANTIRIDAAVPGAPEGKPWIGGWWIVNGSWGAAPRVASEQHDLWASQVSAENPLYVPLLVFAGTKPNPSGWAQPKLRAWVARSTGPVSAEVVDVRIEVEGMR